MKIGTRVPDMKLKQGDKINQLQCEDLYVINMQGVEQA